MWETVFVEVISGMHLVEVLHRTAFDSTGQAQWYCTQVALVYVTLLINQLDVPGKGNNLAGITRDGTSLAP